MTAKAKYLKLTKDDREAVRKAFKQPFIDRIKAEHEAKRIDLLPLIYVELYTAEEARAIKVLQRSGRTAGMDAVYLESKELNDQGKPLTSGYVKFGGRFPFVGASISSNYLSAPADMLRDYFQIGKDEIAATKAVDALLPELNAVLLTAKTRFELGVLWPAVYELMGDKWVEAQYEPNTLPTVTTQRLDAALMALKAAA